MDAKLSLEYYFMEMAFSWNLSKTFLKKKKWYLMAAGMPMLESRLKMKDLFIFQLKSLQISTKVVRSTRYRWGSDSLMVPPGQPNHGWKTFSHGKISKSVEKKKNKVLFLPRC